MRYSDSQLVDESMPDGVIFYSPEDDTYIAVVYRNSMDYLNEHNGYRVSRSFLRECTGKYQADRVIIVEQLLNIWYEYDLNEYFAGTELPPRLTIPNIARGISSEPDVVLDLSLARSSGSLIE